MIPIDYLVYVCLFHFMVKADRMFVSWGWQNFNSNSLKSKYVNHVPRCCPATGILRMAAVAFTFENLLNVIVDSISKCKLPDSALLMAFILDGCQTWDYRAPHNMLQLNQDICKWRVLNCEADRSNYNMKDFTSCWIYLYVV